MSIKIMNPNRWGEPAYAIYENGRVLELTCSSELELDQLPEFSVEDYEYDEVPNGTILYPYYDDAYPEDDPGCCFYVGYKYNMEVKRL